ncbi:hypothetical protein KC367_g5455 [Hortaea werneckii]|nr:hypothetical protein KC354_g10880 [Hortaea werneckii]KAI7497986.1 hypothetical protein KC367_g5455 [Hortaea werneckii]
MSYVPAFERRYKSIGKALSTLTDHASRDTVIGEGKSRLSKFGNATTADAAAIAKEVAILNTALAHAAEEGRVEDVSHLNEELNGWLEHHLHVGERTALAALRQENAGQSKEFEDLQRTVAQREKDKDETIRSLQAELEQQKQASVTKVTEMKNKLDETRIELQAQLEAKEAQTAGLKESLDALEETLGTKDATIADLEGCLEEKKREVNELWARKEKAWDEAGKTVDIANEAFKARAAIDVSKSLRVEVEGELKEAESTIETMSQFCSPADVAKVKQTPEEDEIETVLQRMKSVLDAEGTTVEEMD